MTDRVLEERRVALEPLLCALRRRLHRAHANASVKKTRRCLMRVHASASVSDRWCFLHDHSTASRFGAV